MVDGAAEAVGAGGSASQGEGVALPDERVDVKDLRFTIAEIDKQIAGNKKLLERPTDLRDKKAVAKKLSAMEHLEVLEAERAQYAKLLAEHEGGGDVAQGSMRSVGSKDVGERVTGSRQETMSQGAPEAVERTAGQGNPLTDEEVAAIADAMKANATIAPTVEINDANWKETVDTPIGSVKMGENQKAKLFIKGREQQYGMVIETLSHPDVVLEEKDKEQNMRHERPSLYLFVKTFQKQDGSRYVNFESVTVSHEGMEVAISSHIIRENQLKNKLKSDRLLYKATALDAPANTSAEQPIVGGSLSSERQAVKEGGHILTPESAAGDTQNALSSGGKGSEVSDTKQENLSENDRANLSELKDFAVRTDSGKRTTVDEADFDSENLTVPLLVDGKPSRLSVATIVPGVITDRAYQTAVYDYSDDIDDKTNSGWQKWEDLSDEYNSKVSDEERATVFGDSAELHFKTVDAAVKFDDRLRSGRIEEEQSADDLHNDAAVELLSGAEREAPDGVFRKADGALRGRDVSGYKVFAEDLMERWGLPKGLVRWVSAVTEIPQGERSAIREIMSGSVVRGWFNPKTGGVYLYGGGISSQRDVEETLRHELVAHFGVRALFPQTAEGMAAYNGFLDKVFALMQAADRDYFYEYVTGKKATDADLKRVGKCVALGLEHQTYTLVVVQNLINRSCTAVGRNNKVLMGGSLFFLSCTYLICEVLLCKGTNFC